MSSRYDGRSNENLYSLALDRRGVGGGDMKPERTVLQELALMWLKAANSNAVLRVLLWPSIPAWYLKTTLGYRRVK